MLSEPKTGNETKHSDNNKKSTRNNKKSTRVAARAAPHLFHLAVRLHKVGDLHDLELVQPDRLPLVKRLKLLERSEAGYERVGDTWVRGGAGAGLA